MISVDGDHSRASHDQARSSQCWDETREWECPGHHSPQVRSSSSCAPEHLAPLISVWRRESDHWTGHGDSLTLESVILADASQYHCCTTNTLGESISRGLVLEVRGAPVVEQSLISVDAVEGEQMSVGVKFCSLFHSNPTLDMTLVTTTSTWTMIMVTLNTLSISVSARLSSPERSSLPWSMVAAMVFTPVLIIFPTIIIKNVNQSTEREREEGRGKYLLDIIVFYWNLWLQFILWSSSNKQGNTETWDTGVRFNFLPVIWYYFKVSLNVLHFSLDLRITCYRKT